MGLRGRSAAAVVVLGGLLLAGCGNGKQTDVGAVTTLDGGLCIGRAAATGMCFTQKSSTPFAGALHIGECVKFSFYPGASTDPDRLTSVHSVPASAHRNECPKQPG